MKLVVGGGNQRQGRTIKKENPIAPITKVVIAESNRHDQGLRRERLNLAKVDRMKSCVMGACCKPAIDFSVRGDLLPFQKNQQQIQNLTHYRVKSDRRSSSILDRCQREARSSTTIA